MRILFFTLAVLIFASCSSRLRPFTQKLYDDFSWSENELQRIQFYLSDDIRLWRDSGVERSTIRNGKIRVVDGREIEEIIFKKGTPGVILFSPKTNRFAVSFDDDDDRYLMFGPNPKRDGRYVLLAKEWDRRSGKVTYGGETFNTDPGSSYATLMVDLDAARKRTYSKETVSGRRVND